MQSIEHGTLCDKNCSFQKRCLPYFCILEHMFGGLEFTCSWKHKLAVMCLLILLLSGSSSSHSAESGKKNSAQSRHQNAIEIRVRHSQVCFLGILSEDVLQAEVTSQPVWYRLRCWMLEIMPTQVALLSLKDFFFWTCLFQSYSVLRWSRSWLSYRIVNSEIYTTRCTITTRWFL